MRSAQWEAAKASHRGEAFERFSRAVDGPLTILALAMIPLLVLPLVMDLSPGAESAVMAVAMHSQRRRQKRTGRCHRGAGS
jgi:hypothetical protein